MKSIKWLKYVVFILLSFGLMYLAFKNQNPKTLLAQLNDVEYSWVGVSVLFGAFAIISRAYRWVILLDNLGFSPSKLNSIYAVSIGYFTNIAIPRAGEITRCTSLNQTENIPVDKLFGTIILERAIDFIILISLVVLTLFLKFSLLVELTSTLFEGKTVDTLPTLISIAFLVLLCLVVYRIFKEKIKTSPFLLRVKSFLKGVGEGFKSIKGLKNKTGFWLHTFIIWLMYLLMTYVCFFAISATSMLDIVDGLYTMVIGGFGMVAPVQGGIGAYHYIVKTGLVLLDISEDSALLFATVVHTAQTLMTLAFGGISILMVFLSNKKVKA